MKIRLRPFRTHTRSRTLPEPTADAEVIRSVAGELLERFVLDAPVRLLGVGVAGLSAIDARPAGGPPQGALPPGGEPLVLDVP
jgi:DNA polymerase-4